jgi:hypothetical protein
MVSAIADSMATTQAPAGTSVKLLDLVTNRYHGGLLRRSAGTSVKVEVAATSRLRVGQRVRCIVAPTSSGVLSRTQMRRASVLRVEADAGTPNLLLELAFMDDPTAS